MHQLNVLIVVATNSGKTRYLVNPLSTTSWNFYYIVLCPPVNSTYDGFGENDKDLLILTPLQDQIDDWPKTISYECVGTNTLIILDDCAASRDVKHQKSTGP